MENSALQVELKDIAANIEGAVLEESRDGLTNVIVPADSIYAVCERIKNLGFDLLHSISGVDYDGNLTVVYHVFATSDQSGVIIKTSLPRENPSLPSMTPLWITADWHERETAELYGIEYRGHPDPRHLLLAEDFPGYPLRKDWKHDNLEEYLITY